MTSPILKKFYPLWYHNGKKKVPLEWVEKYLDADGLALWYQDDGCLKNNLDRIILSTDAFQWEEICFLQEEILRNKFKINSTIDTQGRIDISSRKEARKFQSLVEKYIHPAMKRKSISRVLQTLNSISHPEVKRKVFRTSVYLPYELYYQLSGEGYSRKLNEILSYWLDIQMKEFLANPVKIYNWVLAHEHLEKGRFLLTPRFKPHVKSKLDMISIMTGFELSELVVIAIMESK